jgi:hypothetical protein
VTPAAVAAISGETDSGVGGAGACVAGPAVWALATPAPARQATSNAVAIRMNESGSRGKVRVMPLEVYAP